VEKYGGDRQAADENIIRRMRFACWINKATDTRSECVMFIAFLRQKLLRQHASRLRLFLHCLRCLLHLQICNNEH
jgi:hypothetical protein